MIQCRGGVGVCPDTLISGGTGTQDITGLTGRVENGMRCVEYQRPLSTSMCTTVCVCNISPTLGLYAHR